MDIIKIGPQLLLIYFAIVLNIGLSRGSGLYKKYQDVKESKEKLSDALNNMKAENDKLSAEISKIISSPEYAKKVLKDKYHIREANEKLLFFNDE